MRYLLVLLLVFISNAATAVELTGEAIQGGLIFGQTQPGSVVTLDDTGVAISENGYFVIGFGRDESGTPVVVLDDLRDDGFFCILSHALSWHGFLQGRISVVTGWPD